MHNLKNMAAALSVVFIGFLFLSATAMALEIKAMRFGQHGSAVRIVMDMSDEADFRAMVQESPPSLIIDTPALSGKPTIKRSVLPALISDVRLEPLVGNYSRLTLPLEETAIIRSAFLMPADGKQAARLVIDIAPASAEQFKKQSGKPFGTLAINTSTPSKLPFAGIGGTRLEPIGSPDKPVSPDDLPLIMIDAGHGGQDGGAVQGKIIEKNITLAVARDLRTALNAKGKYRVQLTRDKDVFIPLAERVRIARRAGADLFISIHADSAPDAGRSARGASFYTLSETASDRLAAGLAQRENQADILSGVELPDNDKEVADILIDLTMRETIGQSNFLAAKLVSTFRKNGLPMLSGPHKQAGFMVLKAPDIPSILIELGFVSNPEEAKKLTNTTYRASLAESIATGIEAWLKTNKH